MHLKILGASFLKRKYAIISNRYIIKELELERLDFFMKAH